MSSCFSSPEFKRFELFSEFYAQMAFQLPNTLPSTLFILILCPTIKVIELCCQHNTWRITIFAVLFAQTSKKTHSYLQGIDDYLILSYLQGIFPMNAGFIVTKAVIEYNVKLLRLSSLPKTAFFSHTSIKLYNTTISLLFEHKIIKIQDEC